MIYVKAEVNGKLEEIEFYGDELYCRCFKCGKEFQVDDELQKSILVDFGSFSGVSIGCGCKEPYPPDKPNLAIVK